MEKVKVFISQPMKDKTNEQIENERKEIIEKAEKHFGEIEIIDSVIKDAPKDANSLWYLGKSLEFLSKADVCIFAKQWYTARGCVVEHRACEEYYIKIWEM